MTHDELLTKLNPVITVANITKQYHALRAVVELHKPCCDLEECKLCIECNPNVPYPCPTIKAIEEQLK